jgi:hypothetical protein
MQQTVRSDLIDPDNSDCTGDPYYECVVQLFESMVSVY